MDKDIIEKAYGSYWDKVKNVVDDEGWVYTKEVSHLLDYYFEYNTGTAIQFEKVPQDYTRGSRWRPKILNLQ